MNRTLFRTCLTAGAIGLLASCGGDATAPRETGIAPTVPSYDATTAFNNPGQCMADDAVRAPTGTISGVKFGDDPATVLNCTSQDVKIATASVSSYQLADENGNFSGTPIPYNPGDNVTCNDGRLIKLTMSTKLNETANSARADIGIWIATDGGNGQTGACNHYNLPVNPLSGGVTNPDGDSCGDLNVGAVVNDFPLGTFTAVCETAPNSTSSQLHIGSCLGWKEPGGDKICPLADADPTKAPNWVTESPDGYRFGTLFANKSKCNCDGFDVPITVVRPPNLTLTKTADSASVSAGSQIGFTVALSNTGSGPATTVAINDPLPAGTGVSWSLASAVTGWSITGTAPTQTLVYSSSSFAAGASTSVHVISSTTSASCTTYSNTATVTLGNGTAPDPATASITVGCGTLGITKTPATQTVSAGTSFSWTVTLTNNGPGVASGAAINDPLPSLTGVSYTLGAGSAASCVITTGTLTCGPVDLAASGTLVAIINATTTAGSSCSTGGITNTATGSATGLSNVQASATTVINCASIGITKTPATQTISAGSPFSWTVTLTNSGDGAAVGASINDPLPTLTGVSYALGAGSAASCAITAGTLTCGPVDLAKNGTLVAIINATTTAGTSCSASGISNTATGSSTGLSNVQATATTIINCPIIGITKTPATQTVAAGSPFSWTVTLTNTGDGTALAASISDPLPTLTGVSYSLGVGSAASCAINSGTLTCGPVSLAKNATLVAIINATTTAGTSCSASGISNTATGSSTGLSNVQATATTIITCPNLSIVKTPDQAGDAGYTITVPGTAAFAITVSNSSAAGTGSATGVVLTDTLPAGVTWTADNTTQCVNPIGTVVVNSVTRQRLICTIGTLAAGASFTVNVSGPVSSSILQQPDSPAGTSIEIEGDLVDGAAAGKDWASLGSALLNCASNPKVGCDLDKPTGATDDSFGQGTKEDSPVPTVVSGSIPNNKSDLLRFYVSTERFVANDFLYLAWERVQAPNGTTNMDFELNQSDQMSANGKTPVRTAGDILINYDLSKGGTQPTLGFHRWVTTGNAATVCEASNTVPCWGKGTQVLAGGASAVNLSSVVDPILAAGQSSSRTLDALTFGEASIDLQTSGIFQSNVCLNFGQAYLKSRSSDAFTSEIKDFIAPISVSVTNCAPALLNNRAWVTASNISGSRSDPGQIRVTE